ncbi:MAG: hypothetical protein K6T83_00065 [Alicyclobacillus sp.]|nr:hypothetical protein [Alicyclobacillus sp.]
MSPRSIRRVHRSGGAAVRPGLIVGLTLAFARAIGAFGAVIVVAYYPKTLPVSICIALQEQGLLSAMPLALLVIIIALPTPLAAFLWRRATFDRISV